MTDPHMLNPCQTLCGTVDSLWKISDFCSFSGLFTGEFNPIFRQIGPQWPGLSDLIIRNTDLQHFYTFQSSLEATMEEDLPTSTIIIVAVVCGSVVIILTVILVVLCCRRYRTKQKYQKAEAARPPPPVLTHSNGATSGAPLKPALRNGGSGMVNPGMDHTDNIDFDDQRNNGVFATDTSHQLPPGYYNQSNPNPNGYIGNGAPAQSWKNPNGLPPPSYDNSINDELNRRNRESYSSSGKGHKHINPRDKNYLQLDDPYHPHSHNNSKDGHKDLHKDSDSGVSTPDPQKPKKVIYEVVV